jgi:signal transduction histidine kinase
VNLAALVDDVVDLYGPLLEEAGLELGIERQTDLVLEGDRDLLFQALANLVDNGLKHVPIGGQVNLEATRVGQTIRLVVADNGPGIPEAERERVLERFYRLDSSRSTPGAGLGLSLVAVVTDLHQARLELLDNDPGLRVQIDFPQV